MSQLAAWPAGVEIVCSVSSSLSFSIRSAKVRKRHEIILGNAKKVAVEGKSMKLVSEFYMTLAIAGTRKRCLCGFWRASAG